MRNILKKIRDFFFPPFSKRRDVYETVRKGLLMLRKRGFKGTYKELHWRLAKPRRLITPNSAGDSSWNKANPLFDEVFLSQINQLRLTEKVDIIICVGPNQANVIPCLSSIEKYTRADAYNLHLVVHQADIAHLPAHELISKANLISHSMELFNYSRANNLALKLSNNDVVLLNDDTEVSENWLENLRQDSRGVALTGAHTGHMRAGNPQMWGLGPARLTNYPINMFCAYIPHRLRSVVGLLDEEYCYYGGEDVDYSCRALLHGFPLVISTAFVEHKDNQSYKESKEVLIKQSDRILMETYGIEAPFDLSSIKPKVSVILATRNRPDLLQSAIESTLSIAYDNFEFVIVDDYSNKETGQLIYNYQQKDERILSIRLPSNVGSSKARSIGLKASHGQFVLFTDDDDTVFSNRISKPLEFIIHHPWLDVVYCNYNLVSHDDTVTPVLADKFDLHSYMEMEFYIGFGMLLGRRQAFMDVPFMSTYDKAVDYDWVFRLLRKGYQIDLCPDIVMNYNRTGAPRFHLSGNQSSIDLHETIHDREALLQSMERHDKKSEI
jgi:GT2 family glycosyltransferase